jgi:hypothetical protein
MERPEELADPNRGWSLHCARCGEREPMDPIADDRQKVDETIRAFVDLHRDCPDPLLEGDPSAPEPQGTLDGSALQLEVCRRARAAQKDSWPG